jgi:hypothetical protein
MPDEILGWCYSAFFDGMPTSQLSQYTSFISDHNTHKINSLADFRDKYTQVIASFHAHNFAEQYAALYASAPLLLSPLPRHAPSAILQYFAELCSVIQDAGDDQVEEQIREMRRQNEPNSDHAPFFTVMREWFASPASTRPMQPRHPELPHRAQPRDHARPGKENRDPQAHTHTHYTNIPRLLHHMHVLNQTQ